ncbi:MAG: methylmalonyl-CoA mutase small subunit [Bacteroidales bacterium]|nr:methylmalonyl-CoA mutase small subunit [Bacteroidales bacterium]MBN2758222.1 methylmalonyl-CoA mutase small subunit [Bacteroidales bacterium]
MSKNQNKILFSDFPPIPTKAWEEKINKDLKGADYEKKLIWKTNSGINVKPYYRNEDLQNLKYLLEANTNKLENDWLIRQNIKVEDFAKANKKTLNAINKGANSIGFIFYEKQNITIDNFKTLFENFPFDKVEINFSAGKSIKNIFDIFVNYCKSSKIDTKIIKGSFDFDPLSYLAITGRIIDKDYFDKAFFENLNQQFPKMQFIAVNAYNFKNAGASILQELAFAISIGNCYLSKYTEEGIDINQLAPSIKFNFDTSSNYFLEIAKLRAARYLWSKIVEQYNPCCSEKTKMNIHSLTSLWNKTNYDPYVNLLRTTTESMSAVIGGTDSLTVNAFDITYKNADVFSDRIARNQQIILKEESYFNKVQDPSAGSYYIENLTNSLIEEAWKLFLTINEKGGFFESLKQNFIQDEIKRIAKKRDMDIATKKEILLGTNQYPNSNEKIKDDIKNTNIFDVEIDKSDKIIEPIRLYRGAQAFEEIRLKTENFIGKKTEAFLFTYGNLTMRKARAGFSSDFFASGGFKVIDNDGFNTIDEGIEAAKNSKAEIIVICSSDDEYETIVPEILKKLSKEQIIVVAGYPINILEQLKNEGVEYFIHVKSNVLEMLSIFQNKLGIK